MSSNESDSSDREKSPSLMRSNKDQGQRAKWENLWKNTLKEKDLRVAVNLQTIEALMKKEVPHRKSDQKIWRNDIDLEARKAKGKRIEDIHLSLSPSSSSNEDSDQIKYRNNEGTESAESRFRVVSVEDQ